MSPLLTLKRSGKVRELFKVDESSLLMAVTDRISAYDEVLSNGIPDKGAILCQISGSFSMPRFIFPASSRDLDGPSPKTVSPLSKSNQNINYEILRF